MTTAPTVIFPWKDEYSVKFPDIDMQHKQLIKLINDLHEAMLGGRGKEALTKIIDELIRYTKTHFAYEEGMLQRRSYAGLAAHREEHRKLTQQVIDIQERFHKGSIAITMDVMSFLKNWLANHIMSSDQRYSRELAPKS